MSSQALLNPKPSFKPYSLVHGSQIQAQFILQDINQTHYGVIEYYNTNSKLQVPAILFEFVDVKRPEAAKAKLWLNMDTWEIESKGQEHLPDAVFAEAFQAHLSSWTESEKDLRHSRALESRFFEAIKLANQGYSIAYHELFPEDPEFINVKLQNRKEYLLDDQYLIQPGENRHHVTLVFVAQPSKAETLASLIATWNFSGEFDVIESELNENEIEALLSELARQGEISLKLQKRREKMRRQAILLQVRPKPREERPAAS